MGLLEEIEETKTKLAAAIEEEEKPVKEEEKEPEVETEDEPEPADDDKAEDGDEKKPEPEEKEEEPVVANPTNADFARMRREKKALERKLADIEARQSAPKPDPDPTPAPVKSDAVATNKEPDRATQYEAWLEWKDAELERKLASVEEKLSKTTETRENERIIGAAVQEFTGYEADFRAIEPEYDQAASFYVNRMAESIKMLNPSASQGQIAEAVKRSVLQKAAMFANKGLDPAEELFNEAKAFGFTAKPEKEDDAEEETKPNLSRVAANRQRNAGTAGAKGRGGQPNVTREVAASYTNAQWAKLPASEKRRLLEAGN